MVNVVIKHLLYKCQLKMSSYNKLYANTLLTEAHIKGKAIMY